MKLALLFLALVVSGCASNSPAPYMDVTKDYDLPPEMDGCKIYVLGGQWSSKYPIWVIVSPKGDFTSVPSRTH